MPLNALRLQGRESKQANGQDEHRNEHLDEAKSTLLRSAMVAATTFLASGSNCLESKSSRSMPRQNAAQKGSSSAPTASQRPSPA